jgi:hypothetical protein
VADLNLKEHRKANSYKGLLTAPGRLYCNADLYWTKWRFAVYATRTLEGSLDGGGSESLAGRVGIINLLGLSHRETLGQGETSTPFLPLSDAIQERV